MKNIIFIFSLLFTAEIFCKTLTDDDLNLEKNQIAETLNTIFRLNLPLASSESFKESEKEEGVDLPSIEEPIKTSLKKLNISGEYYKKIVVVLKTLIKSTELFIKDSGSKDLQKLFPDLEKLIFTIVGSEPLNGQSLIEVAVNEKNTPKVVTNFKRAGLANGISRQIADLRLEVNKITTYMPSKTRAKKLFQYWVGIPNTTKQNPVAGVLDKLVGKIMKEIT